MGQDLGLSHRSSGIIFRILSDPERPVTLKEFAQAASAGIIAGIMEWDMKPRAQSVILRRIQKYTHHGEHHLCHRRALLGDSARRSAGPESTSFSI